MNRVSRISSAALGMLLLAGLAYYQGDGASVTGEAGTLAGTALRDAPGKPAVDCEDAARRGGQDSESCASKNGPGERN